MPTEATQEEVVDHQEDAPTPPVFDSLDAAPDTTLENESRRLNGLPPKEAPAEVAEESEEVPAVTDAETLNTQPKKTELPKADPVVEPEKKEPELDPEIAKFQPKPGASLKVHDDFRAMKTGWHADRQAKTTAESRVKELEAELAQAKTNTPPPEEVKKLQDRIAQLEQFEFMADPEKSSIITREFDAKQSSIESDIESILVANGMPAKKSGPDDKGISVELLKETGLNKVPFKWWEDNILKNLEGADKKLLEKGLLDLTLLDREKAKAIAEAPKKREEYANSIKTQKEQETQQGQKQMIERLTELASKVPYARKQEIPPNATPEKKAEIEEMNKFHDEIQPVLSKLLNPASPKDLVDLAAGFVHGTWVEKQNASLRTKLAAAENQVKELQAYKAKLQKAGSTRAGSIPPGEVTESKAKGGFLTQTPEEAMAGLDAEN